MQTSRNKLTLMSGMKICAFPFRKNRNGESLEPVAQPVMRKKAHDSIITPSILCVNLRLYSPLKALRQTITDFLSTSIPATFQEINLASHLLACVFIESVGGRMKK